MMTEWLHVGNEHLCVFLFLLLYTFFQVLYCYSHCMWSLFSLFFFLTYCALIKSMDNLMLVIFSSINLFLLLIYTHSILVHLISNNWNHVFFSHCNKRGHFQVCWQDKKYIIRDILLLINKFVTLTVPSICNLAWTQHWENPKSIPGADLRGVQNPLPLRWHVVFKICLPHQPVMPSISGARPP